MHLWSAVSGWINWRTDEQRGIGPYQDMDTISMLLTGWVIFILISVILVKYLYFRFVKKTGFSEYESEVEPLRSSFVPLHDDDNGEISNGIIGDSSSSSGVKSYRGSPKPQAPARRRHKQGLRGQVSGDDHNQAGVCTGPDSSVADFINQVHDWSMKEKGVGDGQAVWVAEVKSAFITALNQVLRDEGSKSDIIINIIDLTLKDNVKLYNMFAECIHPDNVKMTSDCELQLHGLVTLHQKQQLPRRVPFFVDNVSGRLSILVNTADKSAIIKLDGWPEICVAVTFDQDKGAAQFVGDAIASALRNCVTELNYGTESFLQFPVASKFSPRKDATPQVVKYLLATVVRGRELGLAKGCQEAYCAIELDDPPQKFQTDIVRSHDPVWNENFVFNILPKGGELLFEVHDKVGVRFLGCNIISVDEMKSGGPGGRYETLKLKSRKMEDSDGYSGSIDVQFTPLTEPEYLQRSKSNKRGQLSTTTTSRRIFTPSPDSKSSTAFAENVIKELGRMSSQANSSANKISTLIIHAVQRDRGNGEDGPSEAVAIAQYGDERGRRKTRKGDIFTSIRRRFSKGRSHSVMGGDKESSPNNAGGDDGVLPRSVSADRSSNMASTSNNLRQGMGSARSSTSELSGISGFSTTTFIHENSTLVIECVENRVKKYFLVPPNLAESGRYRKKGKKLHIYNDHTFLAKHLPSGTMCEICTMRLPFSIGKQGYQCRDCNMLCHKECHIRAPSFCPKTTIYDIELVYHELSRSSVRKLEPKPCSASSSSGIFSSIFGRGNKVSGVTCNNKGIESDQTNNAFSSPDNTSEDKKQSKKKKSNIFRKMTRLGKISEENLDNNKDDHPNNSNENKQEETSPTTANDQTIENSKESSETAEITKEQEIESLTTSACQKTKEDNLLAPPTVTTIL